jgi:hypothetical protein
MLNNPNLSWKAKGLLSFLLSLPERWAVYKTNLHQFSKDGRDGTVAAFNELIDVGYIQVYERKDNGRFGYDYIVSDKIPDIDIEKQDGIFRNGNSVTEN